MKETDFKTRTLQLIMTERCNLKCRYCFETEKSNRDLPLEMILEKVEKYLSIDDDFDGLLIDFFGGEPLLRFEEIKKTVDFVHSREWPKGHHFNVGTNLTLLTDDMKKWLAHHNGCLTVSSSLDGTKRTHDFNRWNSYDDVIKHVPFLLENWPDQPVKMTIGADMVDDVAQGIIEIIEMGMKVEANVVFEDVWGEGETRLGHLIEFSHQLERLIDYFGDHPDIDLPRFINLGIADIGNGRTAGKPKWCGTGKYMVAVDVEGIEYPCHRFSPYGSNNAAQVHCTQGVTKVESKCDTCPVVDVCPTCHAYNWEVTGDEDQRVGYHCDFIKLQFHATARLQYNLNRSQIEALSNGDIALHAEYADLARLGRLMRGITIVQEELSPPHF